MYRACSSAGEPHRNLDYNARVEIARQAGGLGILTVNSTASPKTNPGDIVIIYAYAEIEKKELVAFTLRLTQVDSYSQITPARNFIPVRSLNSRLR